MAAYREGRSFNDVYKVDKRIATGGFGQVFRCIARKTGEEYAVKKIFEDEEGDKGTIEHEVYICQTLKHRNILQLIEAFCNDDIHYLVFDIMPGGDLFDDIAARTTYSEKDACHCIEQILSGVEYIHSQNVIHRDLKPKNILLTDQHNSAIVKIADFGSAIFNNDEEKVSFPHCGTWLYSPPEWITCESYTPNGDMWSCGVLLYILLIGRYPFRPSDPARLAKLMEANFIFPDDDISDAVCEAARDLIRKLITVDQDQRLTATQALAHEFIRSRATLASPIHRSKTIESLKEFNIEKKEARSCQFPMAAGKMPQPPKSLSDGTLVEHTFGPVKPAGFFEAASEVSRAGSSQVTHTSISTSSEDSGEADVDQTSELISGTGQPAEGQGCGCCSTQ